MMKKLLFLLILITSSIGFSQEKSVEKLSAAPNPFTNSTKITFKSIDSSIIFFTVKNILGKTVYKEKIKTKIGINSIPFTRGNLKTGMYIYSMQNKNKIVSKRFVIK
jgi:uncharacterized membrane protein